jgi:hypothetical protein
MTRKGSTPRPWSGVVGTGKLIFWGFIVITFFFGFLRNYSSFLEMLALLTSRSILWHPREDMTCARCGPSTASAVGDPICCG